MVEKSDGLYECEECSMKYKDETMAKKCEDWCKEKGGCSTEITKHAVV